MRYRSPNRCLKIYYTPTYNRDEPIVALAESLMTITPAEMKEFGVTLPPTQDELPHSDGEPMESQRHKLQMELLIDALLPWLEAREDGYVGANMFSLLQHGTSEKSRLQRTRLLCRAGCMERYY